ncbi:MAG: MerR family transcriptional regulator [Anaerolineae bacterium]|nr:MerR family transcriptional regulator [Anaerolineae bacterium]
MDQLTIGQLARRVGMRTSALRYYEAEGLLSPDDRSDAGYRLYNPQAERTLRFIQQAQHLGFSLADIRTMLDQMEQGGLSGAQLAVLARQRFLDLERRLTELLVLHHEMESLLREVERLAARAEPSGAQFFDRVVDQVCAHPPDDLHATSILDWLVEQTHCALDMAELRGSLEALRGQHVHIWQQEQGYDILVVSEDPAVGAALQTLAQMEASCRAHPQPRIHEHGEGILLRARGDNAFIYARLFLALERE